MIQLEHLRIKDFRGIRLIELPLNSTSFVVHGPNGSGKSGVIDAIDFALTGRIGRLLGAGTGGVTLLRHGPHVHKRDDPGAAVVEITVRDVDSGDTAVLKRSVKESSRFSLEPDSPAVRASVIEAQLHPELTLSRREILQYVVSKPADRAQQVQALLRLDRLEGFRKVLKSTVSKATQELQGVETAVRTAENKVASHLMVDAQLLVSEVEREVNKRRATLGLDLLTKVTIESDLNAGLKNAAARSSFNLASAKREVAVLNTSLGDREVLAELQSDLIGAIDAIANDQSVLEGVQHRQLVESGVAVLSDNHCPLCDHAWETRDALKAHLDEKIRRSNEASNLQNTLATAAAAYRRGVASLKSYVDSVVPYAKTHGVDTLQSRLKTYSSSLHTHEQTVGSKTEEILATRSSLLAAAYAPSSELVTELGQLVETLEMEPDQSEMQAAQTFLALAQERWVDVRIARSALAKAKSVSGKTTLIYEEYCKAVDTALETLYQTVEADFSRYYQIINPDDEGSFSAELKPTAGSLDLSVDFYGLGKFPPTAYHSEGHQDGMGVCLYLALVKQLLGEDFRYSILDDVVMSVDVNHRKQFCRLLKQEFPDVQFIITTHDSVWARQMQSEGLITSKSQARFYSWNVDDGPLYEQGDIWDRIEEDLQREDIPGAAHKLRRRLEAAAADLAHNLGASVPYRGDNSYDLSVLLNGVKGRYKDLLAKAAKAANKWGDEMVKAEVEVKKLARAQVIPEQEGEAWIVNKLVHNNDWVNASVSDFRPVLDATKAFLNLFLCENEKCSGWIRVIGLPEESLKCDCGRFNLNLKS